MSEKEPFIKIRNIRKVFGTGEAALTALDDICLDIYPGEYVSIMGPSGSGKSTLFNMLGALDRPTSGEITVGDVSLPKLKSTQLAYFRGRYIGYVFQSYNLIEHLTALDNTMIPRLLLGYPRKEAEARARELLEYVGLGHRMHHRPAELSGGQQQRVAIARSLVNSPAILLADEPTANLDFKTGQEIIDLFRKLSREKQVTVISATHDHRMLAASSRIVWIAAGRIDHVDDVKDLNIDIGSVGGEA